MSVDTKLLMPLQQVQSPGDSALQQFTRKSIWEQYDAEWNGTTVDGTIVARFARIGGVCFFRIYQEIGPSDTQPAGTWTYQLPIATTALANGMSDVQLFPMADATSLQMTYAYSTPGGSATIYTPLTGPGQTGAVLINGFYET